MLTWTNLIFSNSYQVIYKNRLYNQRKYPNAKTHSKPLYLHHLSILLSHSSIHSQPNNATLVSIPAVGKTYEVRNDLVVRPFKTNHVIPSQGYVIYSVRKKLRKQYLHLKGKQIEKLNKSGVEATLLDDDISIEHRA